MKSEIGLIIVALPYFLTVATWRKVEGCCIFKMNSLKDTAVNEATQLKIGQSPLPCQMVLVLFFWNHSCQASPWCFPYTIARTEVSTFNTGNGCRCLVCLFRKDFWSYTSPGRGLGTRHFQLWNKHFTISQSCYKKHRTIQHIEKEILMLK